MNDEEQCNSFDHGFILPLYLLPSVCLDSIVAIDAKEYSGTELLLSLASLFRSIPIGGRIHHRFNRSPALPNYTTISGSNRFIQAAGIWALARIPHWPYHRTRFIIVK